MSNIKKILKLNESMNDIEVIEEAGGVFTTTGSMYDKDAKIKKNPNEHVHAYGTAAKASYNSKTRENKIIGWVSQTGGGSAISISDLFTAAFGHAGEEHTIYDTQKEAFAAAKKIVDDWAAFLKKHGVKR